MTDLSQGLMAAGFKAGPERLQCLVLALRSAEFVNLEDLESASGSISLHLLVYILAHFIAWQVAWCAGICMHSQ